MDRITFIVCLLHFIRSGHGAELKNILFIAADDMRPELGVFADKDRTPPLYPHIHTPNIDDLASKSLVLKRAYVQQPLCAPSRVSILTGRRPDTTNVHGFHQNFRELGGNFTTLPQFFKNKGYQTIGLGKVFHYSPQEQWNDDPVSWSEPVWHAKGNHEDFNLSWNGIPEDQLTNTPLRDQQLSQKAIETLQRLAPAAKSKSQNFFLGVGFYRPHLPFVFPREMLDLYPESTITIPDPINIHIPSLMPEIGWSNYSFLLKYSDIKSINVTGAFNTTLPDFKIKELRRAYYSTVSFVDHEVGTVLKELERLGLSKSTIVVFWSDHGFHLGENGEWCKHTAFELSNWAPLMMHIPGVTDNGIVTHELTEFVDIFPSLVDAAGYQVPELCPNKSKEVELCVEGISFLPLISKPNHPIKKAVFSQTVRDHYMGYTIKTTRYRYTEWPKFLYGLNKPDYNGIIATELYDHDVDPHENENVVNKPNYSNILPSLQQQLRAGWRSALIQQDLNDITTTGEFNDENGIPPKNPSSFFMTTDVDNDVTKSSASDDGRMTTSSHDATTPSNINVVIKPSTTLDVTRPSATDFVTKSSVYDDVTKSSASDGGKMTSSSHDATTPSNVNVVIKPSTSIDVTRLSATDNITKPSVSNDVTKSSVSGEGQKHRYEDVTQPKAGQNTTVLLKKSFNNSQITDIHLSPSSDVNESRTSTFLTVKAFVNIQDIKQKISSDIQNNIEMSKSKTIIPARKCCSLTETVFISLSASVAVMFVLALFRILKRKIINRSKYRYKLLTSSENDEMCQ